MSSTATGTVDGSPQPEGTKAKRDKTHWLYMSVIVAVIGVVVSIYYYFGWIKAAFFETWTPPADDPNAPVRPARTPVSLVAGLEAMIARSRVRVADVPPCAPSRR